MDAHGAMDQQNPVTADAQLKDRKASAGVPDEHAVWLPVDALRPWDRNPRLNDGKPTERVAESLRHFGFVSPIVVWVGGNRMVAGHTRLKALRALLAEDPTFTPKGAPGPGLARVVFHEFESEAEADLFAMADNKLGELAGWDEERVAELRAEYGADELAIAGFDEVAVAPSEEKPVHAPEEFASYDIDVETAYRCPKCAYEWNGKAK